MWKKKTKKSEKMRSYKGGGKALEQKVKIVIITIFGPFVFFFFRSVFNGSHKFGRRRRRRK